VGATVGFAEGLVVGVDVGVRVGLAVGTKVGLNVGPTVGANVGLIVGFKVGLKVGAAVNSTPEISKVRAYAMSGSGPEGASTTPFADRRKFPTDSTVKVTTCQFRDGDIKPFAWLTAN